MMHLAKNRRAPAKFILAAAFSLTAALLPSSSFAQAYVSHVPPLSPAVPQPMNAPPYGTAGYAQPQPAQASYTQSSAAATNKASPSQSYGFGTTGESHGTQMASLGSASDPDSQAYKVNRLAAKAQRQLKEAATLEEAGAADNTGLDQLAPPPDVIALQQVNKSEAATANSMTDDPVNKGLSLDMRKAAQKEAALSYGARGGLAKRNFEIMERMKGFETVLDRVFDFRALLIRAPSGLMIEPPIIQESVNAVVVTNGGDEAAVADKVFDINKKAKIVTAPRDWRQYLIQSWAQVPPPPRILWPKSEKEQADWDNWVVQGWDAGVAQADEIFEANVNQLVADYNGMVRYKMLLAQDMISAPYTYQDDRGVRGDMNQMRVGDRALRITGPSQFLTKADLWKPANQ